MYTSKEQTERKRAFLRLNWGLANLVLSVPYAYRSGIHKTPNGALFVKLAREQLGYSQKTADETIIHSARRIYQQLKSIN